MRKEHTQFYSLKMAAAAGWATLLVLTTIMGGLWAKGTTWAAVVLGICVAVVLAKLVIIYAHHSKLPALMTLRGFVYQHPNWLSKEDANKAREICKAAFLLLAFDRTKTGCWGKSYLYRRSKSKSGIPLARGSLTGTPMSVVGIMSVAEVSEQEFHEWLIQPLMATLSKLITDDGLYLQGAREAQMGKTAVYEPERHAAGGLLIRLLCKEVSLRDLATLRMLNSATLEPSSWARSIVARALLHATYSDQVPFSIRRAARIKAKALLRQLVDSAKAATLPTRMWVDSLDYGLDVTNQWASVWAILPCLSSEKLPGRLRNELQESIKQLLRAHAGAARSEKELLPSRITYGGEGTGSHVFGTAISLVAWRTLEGGALNLSTCVEAAFEARRALGRLLSFYPEIVEFPSRQEGQDPVTVEGYFAWAGLCLAGACLGISLSADEVLKAVKMVNAIEQAQENTPSETDLAAEVERLIADQAYLRPDIGRVTSHAIARIAVLCRSLES